jgi:hypothetical protein
MLDSRGLNAYLRGMSKAKMWSVSKWMGSMPKHIGIVVAADEQTALTQAYDKLKIPQEERFRVAVSPS